MKIWITICSTTALWSRGMKGLDVWFEKPTFFESKLFNPKDCPFSDEEGKEGFFEEKCWKIQKSGSIERGSVSLGSAFLFGKGREDDPRLQEITKYVWDEVCNHYGNERLGKAWVDRENQGLSKIGDFILELDISITFNSGNHLHIAGNSS